jgi:hypothetical protein
MVTVRQLIMANQDNKTYIIGVLVTSAVSDHGTLKA